MADLIIPIREYIGESYYDWWNDDMQWATNAADLRMAVEYAGYAGQSFDRIVLEIGKCYGGSVYDGLEMYHYLRGLVASLGITVKARITVLAASMGTIIALAADEVELEQTAQFMVHAPAMETGGTSAQIGADLKGLQDTHASLRDIYVARTGQTAEVVEGWMSQDTWLSAAECLTLGLATSVAALAPTTARQPLPEAQASARRARFAGIVARADKRSLRAAGATPKPKTKAAKATRPAATTSPKPMAKTVTPAASTKAAAKPAVLTAQQKANAKIVADLAKQLGVKATIDGAAAEVAEIVAVAEPTTLADGAGMLYTDGPLALDSAVFNDEALTEATDDGVYEAEDGREITVTSGIVTDLTEASQPEEETAAAALSTEALTAAITAALAPLTARLDSMDGQVKAFAKTVPPLPAGSGKPKPQVDAKGKPKPRALSTEHGTL